ncbi:hypothetical protein CSC74_09365 [Pseudoxanthomonas yeongjuensis]|jgi:hypothetical protein|uniref:CD225/dispanin family protein n=1 Tax=Pseudoxanthomonas yeongjuensis TaxID=377616 RepID=UPI001391F6A4|nr:CD225/dispanin family protein [Pseudoxanthomonas yeongjuensis]KAF1717056.1 hypothetical protein CSC74_09365 [Pseudoxanthomonas yeongjuensis]
MSYVPPPASAAPGSIPNHLAWAIIATVLATCLCCPLGLVGIVAIVFSAKVNGLLAQGDIAGAQRASANAKTWCWVATALAIIGLLINIVMFATGGAESYLQMIQQYQ